MDKLWAVDIMGEWECLTLLIKAPDKDTAVVLASEFKASDAFKEQCGTAPSQAEILEPEEIVFQDGTSVVTVAYYVE